MRLLPANAWAALPLAWVGFVAAGAALGRFPKRQWLWPWILIGFSLAAARLEGIGLRGLGFVAPAGHVLGPAIGGGLLLGALTTLIFLGAELGGMQPLLARRSLVAIILGVWMIASTSEEIFVRGWFQSSTSGSLLASALLFGAMHLPLLFAGVDRTSVAIVFASTTLLGGIAAWARAGSGSLYPAIAAHIAFNVGGALGGILGLAVRGELTRARARGA